MSESVAELQQRVFETVSKHLFEQGEPAMDDSGQCRYRVTRNGREMSCAVGCMIPSDRYDPKMEGHSVETLHEKFGSAFPGSHRIKDLLDELQRTHDQTWDESGWRTSDDMRATLERVGRKHKCRTSFLKKLKFKDGR